MSNFRSIAAKLGADVNNMGDLEVWWFLQDHQHKPRIQIRAER